MDTHGDYVKAVRQVAQEQQAPLLEMNTRSTELLTRLGPESSETTLRLDPGRRI